MPAMFSITASRCAPSVRAEGSLKFPSSVDLPPEGGAAGVGVDGAFMVGFDAGAGAAGGAGVFAT